MKWLTTYIITYTLLILATVYTSGCTKNPSDMVAERQFEIRQVSEPLIIDGVLNDNCWSEIEATNLVKSADGSAPELPTTIRAGYDEMNLYLAFECQDTDASSSVTAHDGPVYGDEHVAVYIDANSDRTTYAIIEIAPTGAIRDAFVLSTPEGDRRVFLADWNCDNIKTSVAVYGNDGENSDDRYWIVELAIPFSSFLTAPELPPNPGDSWLANFYRAELTGQREYSALAPTGDDGFHRPKSFLPIVFEDDRNR